MLPFSCSSLAVVDAAHLAMPHLDNNSQTNTVRPLGWQHPGDIALICLAAVLLCMAAALHECLRQKAVGCCYERLPRLQQLHLILST